MTGNAHKESCHKLLLILMRKHGLYIIKTDDSGKMVIAFTIKVKKLFNGKPILRYGAAAFQFIFGKAPNLAAPNLAALVVLFPA